MGYQKHKMKFIGRTSYGGMGFKCAKCKETLVIAADKWEMAVNGTPNSMRPAFGMEEFWAKWLQCSGRFGKSQNKLREAVEKMNKRSVDFNNRFRGFQL